MLAHRLRVAEALILMAISRALIAWVPFGRWAAWLGTRDEGVARLDRAPGTDVVIACVRAVRRASIRYPAAICLPQAMALHWMLWRRGMVSTLVIGVLPDMERTLHDDLHAWIERGGVPIYGRTTHAHVPMLRLSSRNGT